MVRRDDISSRLQRIQEDVNPNTPNVSVAVVTTTPHLHGLAADMYNDPLLVAIALHFEEDDYDSAVENELNLPAHHSDSDQQEQQAVVASLNAAAEPTPDEKEKQRRREARRAGRQQHQQHHSRHNPNSFGGGLPSRRGQQGTRRVRRTENDLNLLRSAQGNVEMSISSEPGGGTRVHHMEPIIKEERSLFSELFDGTEEGERNMKLWDQFMQLSEEKQQRVVRKLNGNGNKQQSALKGHADTTRDPFVGIDRRLRHMLLRQKPSPTMVRQVESTVIADFVKEPQSVHVYRKLDGYRRALYHSVCQYAKLTAKTLHSKAQRVSPAQPADVEVRNANAHFARPTIMLSDYLEKSRDSR